MSLPNTPVDIINMSLDLIGQAQISAIDPPTTKAEVICARWYDHCRRKLLREYVWNFAYALGTATLIGDADFDYSNIYAFPNELVRFISIEGQDEITKATRYQISGRTILYDGSDAASIQIRFVTDVTDVSKWDDLFREIMVLTLALSLSYAFTKSKSDVERINSLLSLALPSAISIDGQERPPYRKEQSRLKSSRLNLIGGDVAGQWTNFES